MRIHHYPWSGFNVKNLLEDLVPALSWWDWLLEKANQAGQVCSILALLYWSWSMIWKIVCACTDSRKLKIPMSTALQINVKLQDQLRTLLYKETRGAPLPPEVLHRPVTSPPPVQGAAAEL